MGLNSGPKFAYRDDTVIELESSEDRLIKVIGGGKNGSSC